MNEIKAKFSYYSEENYNALCGFLIELNREQKFHINWNWARWEWMNGLEDFDKNLINSIGLWKNNDKIVGAAVYDQFFGEAFCGVLPEYKELLPQIIEYAYINLKDENGLGIAVDDEDIFSKAQFENLEFVKSEQDETILRIALDRPFEYNLLPELEIKEVTFPEDEYKYKKVLWQGFDHKDDIAEFEQSLHNKDALNRFSYPHRKPYLSLSVTNNSGEHIAHCTCWYDRRTDYAYVEPVCTIPRYRSKGLGKSVVLEALNRCRRLGAKQAFVISDLEFYKKLGFKEYSHHTFYWKS